MKKIPYGSQCISDEDISSVVEVLKSPYLTQGPQVSNFEQSVLSYTNAKYGIAVNSATSALHIACLALGLKEGDFLWTSANTFVASANCALYCGANVDFIDIDPDTYNICPQQLESKLENASKNDVLPKIVVPVHLCGQSPDMEKIYALSKKFGFKIIEDASHAIGAKYINENRDFSPVGDLKFSDICIFSFHPVKIVTSGEGGVAVTNNKKLADQMRILSSHGISRDINEMRNEHLDEIWNYQQIDLGFNYRITDIQSALGISQMRKIDQFVQRRHEIAKTYNSELANLPIKLPFQNSFSYSSYHLYPIRILDSFEEKTQKQIYEELHLKGIMVNLHYIPVYRHPYFKALGFSKGYCPESERFFKDAISIPIHPGLTSGDIKRVIHELKMAFS
jgi:UDP-4-amino-4,6-dideoxy-N-acetyl-beta-L-altrosamine transaminase